MKRYDSIVIRLTGLVFILLLLTISILLILVNNQMDNHFSQYLSNMSHMMGNSQMGMGGMGSMHGTMHGPAESTYISAVHQSLLWVGLGMIGVSVVVSYFVVREIMRPLSTLTGAVQKSGPGVTARPYRLSGMMKWAS